MMIIVLITMEMNMMIMLFDYLEQTRVFLLWVTCIGSENVHCATFLDSMIRKFLKDGKLRLNVSIIPMKAKEVPKKRIFRFIRNSSKTPLKGHYV